MRIFFAVFPSAEAQEAAFATVGRLRRANDGVSWVKRENLHYTLRFMGELGERGLMRATAAARAAVAGRAPFAARLGAAGAFPNPRRARVLWLGLAEGGEALVALAASLERSLAAQGFDRAERAFSPHLTIGRVRRGDEDWSARLSALAAGASDPGAPAFTVDRVLVVQSTLSPGGSIYQVRAEAALAA